MTVRSARTPRRASGCAISRRGLKLKVLCNGATALMLTIGPAAAN